MNREERWKFRLALLGLASFAPAGWSIATGPAPAARPPEAAAMADDREPTRRVTWPRWEIDATPEARAIDGGRVRDRGAPEHREGSLMATQKVRRPKACGLPVLMTHREVAGHFRPRIGLSVPYR